MNLNHKMIPLALLALLAASTLPAADWIATSPSDFTVGSNWSDGNPPNGYVYVCNGGTANLNTTSPFSYSFGQLCIGNATSDGGMSGTLNIQSAGTIAVSGGLYVGWGSPTDSISELNMTAGSITASGFHSGGSGTGLNGDSEIDLSNAASIAISGGAFFSQAGSGSGSSTTLNMSGTSQFTATGQMEFGQVGTTTVTLTGSSVISAANYITLGPNNGTYDTTYCTLSLSGSSQFKSTNNDVWLGFNSSSSTTLNGSSQISAAGSLRIGQDSSGTTANSSIVYLHDSAQLTCGGEFAIGRTGQATGGALPRRRCESNPRRRRQLGHRRRRRQFHDQRLFGVLGVFGRHSYENRR